MRRLYPKLKHSGMEWLGNIPAHWEVKRGRFCMAINPPLEVSLPPEADVSFVPMEAVGEYGGLDLSESCPFEEIGSGYTPFQNGDVIVAKITPCFENGKGALVSGLCNGVAFGTTELHVLRPSRLLERRYLFYITLSTGYRRSAEAEMYGAGGQKRVPPEFNSDFRTPVPPFAEQIAIADFLDRKTAEIDALVAKKRALIEKLKEKRSALISRTVTRGLPAEAARAAGIEPNPKMNASGIESIGDVPQHWQIARLGRKIMLQRGVDITKERQNVGTVPVVSSGGVSSWHDVALASAPGIVVGRKGTAGAVYYITEPFWPHDTSLWVKEFKGNHPRYVFYKLSAMDLSSFDTGSANPTVNRNLVHPIPVSWPPLLEQRAIADFLDRETAKIDSLVAKIEQAIERLQEYRTALITAAVTGKIDVRTESGLGGLRGQGGRADTVGGPAGRGAYA